MNYSFPTRLRLAALDVDGTVLNDRKELTAPVRDAIRRCLDDGLEVVFCTGRSLAEMRELLSHFPKMHYLVGESGAMVWDLQENRAISLSLISVAELEIVRKCISGRDICPVAFSRGECLMHPAQARILEEYQLAPYKDTMPGMTTPAEDVLGTAIAAGGAEKVNLFHRSTADREVSRKILQDLGSRMVMVNAEISSLECSAEGISKGSGLAALGRAVGIGREEMLMAGDADNDLEAMHFASFTAVMGNAAAHIKACADFVAADNNHDGCAQILELFREAAQHRS